MSKTEKRFAVGDTLTYLPRKSFKKGEYYFYGECHGGKTGTIIEYRNYNSDSKCWEIFVTTRPGQRHYQMLESEFEEYLVESINNYQIY